MWLLSIYSNALSRSNNRDDPYMCPYFWVTMYYKYHELCGAYLRKNSFLHCWFRLHRYRAVFFCFLCKGVSLLHVVTLKREVGYIFKGEYRNWYWTRKDALLRRFTPFSMKFSPFSFHPFSFFSPAAYTPHHSSLHNIYPWHSPCTGSSLPLG